MHYEMNRVHTLDESCVQWCDQYWGDGRFDSCFMPGDSIPKALRWKFGQKRISSTHRQRTNFGNLL